MPNRTIAVAGVSGFETPAPAQAAALWPKGGPFFRSAGPNARTAVVALHGYGATPFEVRTVAEACVARGMDVVAPLQVGHGYRERADQIRGFAALDASSLLEVARADVRACRARGYERIVLFGQSMGGAVALALASEGLVDAVATAAPALRLPRVVALAEGVARVLPWPLPAPKPAESFENYFYRFHTAASLRAIREVSRIAREGLREISCPVLVAHTRKDPLISPTVGSLIAREVQGPFEMRWFDDSGHSMTVDVCGPEIAKAVAGFLGAA